jgi:hypothetical protein
MNNFLIKITGYYASLSATIIVNIFNKLPRRSSRLSLCNEVFMNPDDGGRESLRNVDYNVSLTWLMA